MTPTIDLIKSHSVYREFDPTIKIPLNELHQMLLAGKQAPSWLNGQHYSIINITDPEIRQKIVELQPRNPQLAQCSVLLVFVMDGYRSSVASEAYHGSFAGFGDADTLITLATDTAMVAQNVSISAESLGYATCPIGGLRLIAGELITLLKLPKYTYPVFGLCIGKPAVEMRVKPRLAIDAVVFENHYQTDKLPELIAKYEQVLLDFAEPREKLPYRQKFANYYNQPYVAKGEELLKKQGFLQ